MQGKGLIKWVALILGLICLNELIPTWYASHIEDRARAIAGRDETRYKKELQRIGKDTLNLGFTSMDYYEADQRRMKLGLDLKGGMNVLLEIRQRDLVMDLTDYSTNPILLEALDKTDEVQKNSTNSYIQDFFAQFDAVNKARGANLKLANPEIFGTPKLSESIKYKSTDDEVKAIISRKIDESVSSAYEIIRTRIDKMGVTQPNVQRVPGTGRIQVELPGVLDKEKVKKQLQTSAKLQFWEVQSLQEIAPYLQQLQTLISSKGDSLGVSKTTDLAQLLKVGPGAAIGNIQLSDTARVNRILESNMAKSLRPINLKYTRFLYAYKPEASTPDQIALYAIRGNVTGKAPVDGAVEEARIRYDDFNPNKVFVDMQMDSEGARDWKMMTERNVGKPVAVSLDDRVYTAPMVNDVIPSGRTQISGDFTSQEAQELVNALGAGRLPAGAKLVQSEEVGPSLGAESIQSGIISFIVAFFIIIAYIIFYYGGAGVYAVIAMIINLFYIFGIMDSVDATLTLPGIAGIVLTMAIAVDTNVIIYERTREELFAGKSIREAYVDGFKHALSAIIDGHLTSILTAIVLLVFGTGPIKGFAVTMLIGLIMTFFTSVLLSRVMIFSRLDKGKTLSVWTPFTKNLFRDIHLKFIPKRKITYVISIILMVISIVSIFVNGFKLGVDFNGGRSYIVRFDRPVDANAIETSLSTVFSTKDGKDNSVDVKTFGNDSQIKITTDYRISDVSVSADTEIEKKIFESVKNNLPGGVTFEKFASGEKYQFGIISQSKVGPTVADDIKTGGSLAVLASLAGIFIYILFRFRKWQFSLGAVVGLFHDAVIILGAYSLFYKVAPFNMEINQDFIAAILTVLGYSINDTVIVFDRIREYIREKKANNLQELFDESISSTLGRTFNTSITVILVILAIFIFGGDNLRGFMFALLLGIAFGTYSSIFTASAIAYDTLRKKKRDDEILVKRI